MLAEWSGACRATVATLPRPLPWQRARPANGDSRAFSVGARFRHELEAQAVGNRLAEGVGSPMRRQSDARAALEVAHGYWGFSDSMKEAARLCRHFPNCGRQVT